MKITRDRATDMAYIKLSAEPVARTLEASPEVYFDLDAAGHLVGVELLRASAYLDRDEWSLTVPAEIREGETVKPELVLS